MCRPIAYQQIPHCWRLARCEVIVGGPLSIYSRFDIDFRLCFFLLKWTVSGGIDTISGMESTTITSIHWLFPMSSNRHLTLMARYLYMFSMRYKRVSTSDKFLQGLFGNTSILSITPLSDTAHGRVSGYQAVFEEVRNSIARLYHLLC